MGVIIFNGLNSHDYGIEVTTFPNYVIPQKDYSTIHIPGRNGDLVIDKGSYQNIDQEYEISFDATQHPFSSCAKAIAQWLHSSSGYGRLEDSYDSDYFRIAAFISGPTEITNLFHKAGTSTITFNCKPYRYLKSGEITQTFSSSPATIENNTAYSSLPLIKVNGSNSGVLTIGNYSVSISAIDGNVVIDSEIQDAYKGSTNKNSTITLGTKGFPKIDPGTNQITFSGGITSVEVTPRWWTL